MKNLVSAERFVLKRDISKLQNLSRRLKRMRTKTKERKIKKI